MVIRLICMDNTWKRRRGYWNRGFDMRRVRGRIICTCECSLCARLGNDRETGLGVSADV